MDVRVIVSKPGDPTVLQIESCPEERPGPGEIRIRHVVIDVNFIDIYQRSGLYPLPEPHVPGVAGGGVIEAIGKGVLNCQPGDRIVYGGLPGGAYAATRLIPAHMVVPVPEGISMELATATFFKGLTAHMLLHRVYQVAPESIVLIHAAAGGLGGILVKWAKILGAMVIGTVGSDAKAEKARASGADYVIVGRDTDVSKAVAEITSGTGVDYAIDGIGGHTLLRTLACVRKFGVVASIGQAAGPIPPVPVEVLGPARSLCLARPSIMAYASDSKSYRSGAAELIRLIVSGFEARIGAVFALTDAEFAHAQLETGKSDGSLLLMP